METRLSALYGFLADRYVEVAFLIALVATSGSLYFSNILEWAPCHLCWLQRIFMYPLVVLLGVGLVFQKDDVADYVIPMSLFGTAIATYHYPVQLKVISSPGCSEFATSCSMTYTNMFGYITVPMMSLTAFVAILILVWRFG
ncbi:MAG: disulfide bond formation protein B [Nanohaloarchaea archaeon QH_8_44_6]|nr:MAG: disulfide bond formation protein B [Nanohaloarchaea archaeon QH_8_44_6]